MSPDQLVRSGERSYLCGALPIPALQALPSLDIVIPPTRAGIRHLRMRNPASLRLSSVLSILFLGAVAAAMAQRQPDGFLRPPGPQDPNVYAHLTSSITRTIVPLNGVWQVSFDEGDSWSQLQVPCSYAEEDHFVLRRSFALTPELIASRKWKIECYGIQYQSTITINGQFVAQHESGMPFTITIPDEVRLKERNVISVEVTNRLDYTSTVPLRKLLLGNRTYGGIFRDIILVGVPRVWVDDVGFDTRSTGSGAMAKFRVNVISGEIKGMRLVRPADSGTLATSTIDGSSADFQLSVSIRIPATADSGSATVVGHADVPFTLQSKRTATLDVSVPVSNPLLWEPGAPHLYETHVEVRYGGVLVDEQYLNVGFRTIQTRGGAPSPEGGDRVGEVVLNGQAIRLRGIVYVEDSMDGGATLSYAQMRRDITTIRDMGVNVVRFVDGVPHPYLLQLCDELGLMAIIDVPIGSPPSSLFGDVSYLKRARDRVRFTVEEASVNTSVIAYGLSAVIPGGSEAALKAVQMMRGVVDSLDHRLFYVSASDWSDPGLRKVADIAAISAFDLSPQWTKAHLLRVRKELKGEKPLILISYGKFVQLGNHNGYSDSVSIEAQAKYVSDIYGVIADVGVAGGVYWAFNDYRTDRPLLTVNNDDQYIATCGVYGLDRDLRQSATMLAALYTDQRPPEVLIGDYTPPSTILFIATGIGCAIVFLVLINSSRRFRENVFRALLRPFNFYSDIRDQRILSTVHTTVLGLVVAVTFALIVASLCYYYRMDESFDATLSAIITSDWMKEALNYIIWRPLLAIITFTACFFGVMMLVAGLIRLCAAFVRNRIFFRDAYVISVWGALPVLVLIIPAMILYRALAVPGMGVATFSVMLGVVAWMVYRVLRGTAVIYDVRPLKVYGYALGAILAITLLMIVTSSEISTTFAYLREGIGGLYIGK